MNEKLGTKRRNPTNRLSDVAFGRKHKPDYLLFLSMAVLLTVGLVVIYSVSPAISARLVGDVDPNHFMYRQLIFLALGFSVFTFASLVPLRLWEVAQKYILWAAIISFFFLLIPALSINYGGATRWVSLGPINYQPAELLKFGLIFYMALFFTNKIKSGTLALSSTTSSFLVIFLLVSAEIVVLQKDLGTMIPIAAILLSMLFLSGIPMRRYVIIIAIIGIGGILAIAGAGHRRDRVFTFLNPNADTSGTGYHINQALIAVGSGGMFGKGLGRSVQAYGYLPEAANDSIAAIMAEKFGFVGMISIFLAYGLLLFRLVNIVISAPTTYLRLVSGGIFAWMSVQAFVNIGAMLGIMPLTGVTLPLLSFGGTSLIFTMAALGVAFNISRYTKYVNEIPERQEHEDSTRGRRIGRARYPA